MKIVLFFCSLAQENKEISHLLSGKVVSNLYLAHKEVE